MRYPEIMKRGGKIFLWVLLGVGVVLLFTLLTQQLWNWLVPRLFAGPPITFWQTAGLLLLSKILLSPLGGGRGCGPSQAPHWKKSLHNKFSQMTPEEREAWKKKMKEKWCSAEPPAGGIDSANE